MPISGLRVSDVIASAKIGMRACYTEALELHNVQVNADRRPGLPNQDSKEPELDSVSDRKPLADAPVVRLDRCSAPSCETAGRLPARKRFFPPAKAS